MFKRIAPTLAAFAIVAGSSAGLLATAAGTAGANPLSPKISVYVGYPANQSTKETVEIVGSGFTPGGNVWVGVNPTGGLTDGTANVALCNGVTLGQYGVVPSNSWCSIQGGVTASVRRGIRAGGTFDVIITMKHVYTGCPLSGRVDANDRTTNTDSNQVTFAPGYCIS